ncbi:MAG: hypothetical protein WBC78_02770 [Candidatus Sulfotelmatobacter sp.]
MSDDYKAGLTEDELSQFPSAANPLTAMGLDPDEVAANPELLAGLDLRNSTPSARVPYRDTSSTSSPSSPPSRSAVSPMISGAPTAPQTPDADTEATDALRKNLGSLTETANAVPTSTPEIDQLTAQRAKLATPAPLYDKQTGKILAQDRPSTGQKIWRGVRGGLVGLATGGIPGAIVGAVEPGNIRGGQAYGAPNANYTRGEQRREQELGATDQSLEQARTNWKNAVDAMKAKGGLLKDATTTASDMLTGSARVQNAVTNQFKAEATADNYKEKTDEFSQKLQEETNKRLQQAQTAEQRLQIMRDSMTQLNQIREAQLQLAQQKLTNTNDAKAVDQWEKEQIDSINKDYGGVIGGLWNRMLSGSRQDRISQIQRTANQRRAALGIPNMDVSRPSVPGGPRQPANAPPAGATHIAPGRDGRNHYTNATGTVDYGLAPQ